MSHLVKNKIVEFRRNAAACEDWATTVNYPDIRQALLDIARQWREMADRFERLQVSLPFDEGS
jgi:transcription initiation factor IIE alpha subunit